MCFGYISEIAFACLKQQVSLLSVAGLLISLGIERRCAADIFVFGSGSDQFSMEFVEIAHVGNAPDLTGSPSPAGAVNYRYQMGKFEVSREMVNAANSAGGLGITLATMQGLGGIRSNIPATGISWVEAARFVNWLNVDQGYSPAYKFALQPGDAGYDIRGGSELWQSTDVGYNPANPFRNSAAKFVLPSLDEWYKAAYFDPSTGLYFDYATGSDSLPVAVSSGTNPGTAVWMQSTSAGPAEISLAGGLSPFGTMAQGGNALEVLESAFDLMNDDPGERREMRGGAYFSSTVGTLASNNRGSGAPPLSESSFVGFRVAVVPEPNSAAVVLLGLSLIVMLRTKGAKSRRASSISG